jgi:hypothetical protein
MVDRFICALVIVVIPATVLATAYRWLSVELALSIVWATFLLTIAVGLLKYWQDAEAYNPPGQVRKGLTPRQ